jgi:hypothetical protein
MTHFEGWENTWASFDDGTVEAFREKTGLDTKKDLKLGDSLPIWQVPPSFCALRPAITSTAMYLWLMVVGYPAERRLVKAQPRDTPNCTSNRHSPRHGQARKKAHEYCRSVRAKLNRHPTAKASTDCKRFSPSGPNNHRCHDPVFRFRMPTFERSLGSGSSIELANFKSVSIEGTLSPLSSLARVERERPVRSETAPLVNPRCSRNVRSSTPLNILFLLSR